MSEFKIFYSWQSDDKENKNLISSSLEKVSKKLKLPTEVVIDRDTKGIMGSPDIASTILNKIKSCDIFVADITLVGKYRENRYTPNPNVLLELGYAAATIGWSNIILMYDLKHGGIEQLPFDLKTRRVLAYDSYNPNVKDRLISELTSIIETKYKESKMSSKLIGYNPVDDNKTDYLQMIRVPDVMDYIVKQETMSIISYKNVIKQIKKYENKVKTDEIPLQNIDSNDEYEEVIEYISTHEGIDKNIVMNFLYNGDEFIRYELFDIYKYVVYENDKEVLSKEYNSYYVLNSILTRKVQQDIRNTKIELRINKKYIKQVLEYDANWDGYLIMKDLLEGKFGEFHNFFVTVSDKDDEYEYNELKQYLAIPLVENDEYVFTINIGELTSAEDMFYLPQRIIFEPKDNLKKFNIKCIIKNIDDDYILYDGNMCVKVV